LTLARLSPVLASYHEKEKERKEKKEERKKKIYL
jgi:hypothetical protein